MAIGRALAARAKAGYPDGMEIDRRIHRRGGDAAARRKLAALFALAALLTAAVFWALHASGVVGR